MITPITLICKALFPSISTFEIPPNFEFSCQAGRLPDTLAEWHNVENARENPARRPLRRYRAGGCHLGRDGRRSRGGGVSKVDIDGNNALQIKVIGVIISTFET